MEENKMFWFHFERYEKKDAINAISVSKVLSSMNSLFLLVAEGKGLINEEYRRDSFQAYLANTIREGSNACGVFVSAEPISKNRSSSDMISENNERIIPTDLVIDIVKKIIENSDDEKSISFIKQEFDKRFVLKIISKLIELCPISGKEYFVTYNKRDEPWENAEFRVKFDKNKQKIFKKWQLEEKTLQNEYVDVFYDGVRYRSEKFYVFDLSEKQMICELNEDLEEMYFPLSPGLIYRIYGEIETIPNKIPRVRNISDIIFVGHKETYEELFKEYQEDYFEILKLKEGWNGPKSTTYDEKILDTSIIFLSKLKFETFSKKGITIPLPDMFPGAKGGIELEFAENNFDLQISIRNDEDNTIEIGGESNKNTAIKPYFDTIERFEIKDSFFDWIEEVY